MPALPPPNTARRRGCDDWRLGNSLAGSGGRVLFIDFFGKGQERCFDFGKLTLKRLCAPEILREGADYDSIHRAPLALGHTTLQQAENHTREADRRKDGRREVLKLNDHKANRNAQTAPERLGKIEKTKEKPK
jgi:hypothetical protein